MIAVNDIVKVSLAEGGTLFEYIVKDVPGNNLIYWTLESPTGETVVVGPSMLLMTKLA